MFQVGQKVICVRADMSGDLLQEGKVYVVSAVIPEEKDVSVEGVAGNWWEERFEPLTAGSSL